MHNRFLDDICYITFFKKFSDGGSYELHWPLAILDCPVVCCCWYDNIFTGWVLVEYGDGDVEGAVTNWPDWVYCWWPKPIFSAEIPLGCGDGDKLGSVLNVVNLDSRVVCRGIVVMIVLLPPLIWEAEACAIGEYCPWRWANIVVEGIAIPPCCCDGGAGGKL